MNHRHRAGPIALLVAFLTVLGLAYAEDPPAVQTVPTEAGAAVVVPAPPNATAEQTKQVGEAAAKTLKDVAAGAVPIEKATRDLRETYDTGQNSTFWILTIAFGLIVRPCLDWLIHRSSIPDDLAGRIMLGLSVLFFLAFYGLLHGGDPALPQDWQSWFFAGFGAAGAGAVSSIPKPKVA